MTDNESSNHRFKEAAQRVKEAGAKVDAHARDNPWIYVGAAALVGFLVGLILRAFKCSGPGGR